MKKSLLTTLIVVVCLVLSFCAKAQTVNITVNKQMSEADSKEVASILSKLKTSDYRVSVGSNNKVSTYGSLGAGKVVGGKKVVAGAAIGNRASIHDSISDFFGSKGKGLSVTNRAVLQRLQAITNKYQ